MVLPTAPVRELQVLRRLFEVAIEMRELAVVVEVHGQAFLHAFTATGLVAVEIVPAVLVEGVANQRGAKDEGDLAFVEAGRSWSTISCVMMLPCGMSMR